MKEGKMKVEIRENNKEIFISLDEGIYPRELRLSFKEWDKVKTEVEISLNRDESLKFQRLAEILQKAKNEPLARQLEEFRTAIRLDVPIWVLNSLNELIKNTTEKEKR